MKIGYTSDIHIDINRKFPVLQEISKIALKEKIEMLLIGGDISNSPAISISKMDLLEEMLDIPVHFVFGNHDYYDCEHLFFKYRDQIERFPFVRRGIGFIGDTGWYDYSWYYNGSRNLHQIKKGKTSSGFTWPDHRFINWPANIFGEDPSEWFTKHTLKEMKSQDAVLDQLGITRKIVMIHMVPHRDLLLNNLAYLETNVFFGSQCFQDWISELKPEIVLFGHTHFSYDRIINGVWYISSPVGYHFEWGTSNVAEYVKRKLIILEV